MKDNNVGQWQGNENNIKKREITTHSPNFIYTQCKLTEMIISQTDINVFH